MNDILSVEKVRKALTECELHLKRMQFARGKLEDLMPLDEASFRGLTDDDVEALDQYIFRFTKLQDAMGERLFPHILGLLEEPARSQPFLDKLNRLEQLGVIAAKSDWLELRALRNQLTHEYEDNADSMSAAINQVYASFERIEQLYRQADDFIRPYLS